MINALLLGAGFGMGLWALAVWLVPPRPSLATVLARSRLLSSAITGTGPDKSANVGPHVAALMALGLPSARLARDLGVLNRSVSAHLAHKASLAFGGFVLPVFAHAVLALAGIALEIRLSVAVALVLAALGFLVPDLRVRREAAALRVGFRHALSAYLDLVWITLAGGAGVISALDDSAAIGRGWAFARLRAALDRARLTRTTPWAELAQLGDDLGVTELTELASSISLAGTEGAKVRQSLAAKAAALRTHQITAAEAEAQAATERMSLPVMALFLGFLTFIAYPALTQVLNGL